MSQGEGGGRPEVWTKDKKKEAIDKILAAIATSTDSVTTICGEDETLPSFTTFFKWKREDEKLAQDYARAKEEQAELIFEDMLDIADDGSNDYMDKKMPNGDVIEVLNAEHIQRSRLRIDARKWVLGKLRPKKYGDFTRNELSGPDGGPLEIKSIADLLSNAHD